VRRPVAPALALLIGIWGTTFAAIRVGLQGIPPLTGLSLRFLLAGAVLVLVGAARGKAWPGDRREWALAATNALGTFGVPYVLTYWAEQTLPSGLTAVLFSTFPLFVAGLAHLVLAAERLRWSHAGGMLLGCLGVAVLFSEELSALGGSGARRVALLFLIGPLLSAGAHVAVKRWGRGVSPLTLTCLPVLAAGAVAGLGALALERQRPLTLDATSVGALVYLALAGTVVTFLVYFWLLERVRATRLSLITYGIPVVAVSVGALFLGEQLTLRMLAGGAMVLAGVGLVMGLGRRTFSPQRDLT
jgi:drug/metabolite transporter (DMT)-like permease